MRNVGGERREKKRRKKLDEKGERCDVPEHNYSAHISYTTFCWSKNFPRNPRMRIFLLTCLIMRKCERFAFAIILLLSLCCCSLFLFKIHIYKALASRCLQQLVFAKEKRRKRWYWAKCSKKKANKELSLSHFLSLLQNILPHHLPSQLFSLPEHSSTSSIKCIVRYLRDDVSALQCKWVVILLKNQQKNEKN